MEPRSNVPKTPEGSSEGLPRHVESRLKGRFSIEPLEERIAPDKGGTGGSAGPGPSYGL
jgi:hypothetical protein